MLLDDLANYLSTSGLTAPVQKGQIVETPDTVVALRETGGFPSAYLMSSQPNRTALDQPTVQVLARGADYVTAMTTARAAYALLNGASNYVSSGVQVFAFIAAMQPPFFLHRDDNHRFVCAFNVSVKRASSVA